MKIPEFNLDQRRAIAIFAIAATALALISAGAGNPFGHPADETLEKFESSLIGRTDQMGTIRVRWWPLEISH